MKLNTKLNHAETLRNA